MEEAVQVLVENSKRFGISELPLQNGSLKKSPQNNIIDPPMLPLCEICGDKSTGRHYKVFSCEGCKNFFRRSVRREREYKCPAYGRCAVDKSQRTRCRACRMAKCLRIGMRKEGQLITFEKLQFYLLISCAKASSERSSNYNVHRFGFDIINNIIGKGKNFWIIEV